MLKYNLKTSQGRFFAIAFLEGVSFLVLLFIAMPLKYLADKPEMVKKVGMAHGLLFVVYVITLVQVATENNWQFKKAFTAFAVSFLPFGTFWFEAKQK